jgi:hypothetical protein
MTRDFRASAVRGLAALGLALCMLTLIPAASVSFTSAPVQRGYSVIHKNGDTPLWMARAIEREIGGVWI